ncbi:hypothetical protein [Algibacillus agarilyticus]|uniref:hypothetical protein n=1 Tax=Algibacillus agarilyticus TaxID=2234133 RepID=UPI000DD0067B|nr:hypothetical protein [Algibacillus agarilyticus]
MKKIILRALFPFIAGTSVANADEMTGNIGVEGRYFLQDSQFNQQLDQQFTVHAETEFYFAIGEQGNSLTITPYLRVDNQDAARNQFDLREFLFLYIADEWEVKAGLGKVFWGVTETTHLVDIVNQTDNLASFDGEEKLGQPMVHFSTVRDWGIVDALILPGFRERRFSGEAGRIRSGLPTLASAAYESADKKDHVDFAFRWSNTLGDWDLGLTAFNGTAREAEFIPVVKSPDDIRLQPFYGQITQFGLDAQYIYDSWLFKLEAISRSSKTMQDTQAVVGGFEYSQVGLLDSAIDLGWVVEYAYDHRDAVFAARQNDISFATRWALNDAESTEFLVGFSQDLDYSNSRSAFVEGSTRLGDRMTLTIDAWFFTANDPAELSYNIRQDDFIQVDVSYFF